MNKQSISHNVQEKPENNKENVEIKCDCTKVCCGPSDEENSNKSWQSKIKKFFFYAIILTAVVVLIMSIFNY